MAANPQATFDSSAPGEGHWFEGLADHLGGAYLRYSFTKGTVREVDSLIGLLGLEPGHSLLDVGCGPGRHSHEFARRGVEVVGIDISDRFIQLARADAPDGATFQRGDARLLDFGPTFDAAISLCQGAFGLGGPATDADDPQLLEPDQAVLEGIGRALRPGGRFAISAFSAYFQLANLETSDQFDAASGVNHELTEIRSESGESTEADLWTTCYTPRELRLLIERAGLEVDSIHSADTGTYRPLDPSISTPELLVLGRRP
ncbi:MAG: class I SAM-dependent methyltransferase [Microthrixaceae bacterium]|nr:class I SAM-dependent methyltransferase [Microthrixaceae bacterium]